jgi:hypothetical protein
VFLSNNENIVILREKKKTTHNSFESFLTDRAGEWAQKFLIICIN